MQTLRLRLLYLCYSRTWSRNKNLHHSSLCKTQHCYHQSHHFLQQHRYQCALMERTKDVLDVNELLEQILLRLPMKDILRARAVCRHWKSMIKSSLPLKRATFCASDSAEGLLVDKAFATPYWAHLITIPPLHADRIRVNPIFTRVPYMEYPHRYYRDDVDPAEPPPLRIEARVVHHFVIRSQAVSDGSRFEAFRCMFFTQPPCTALAPSTYDRRDLDPPIATLWKPQGITFGQAFDTWETMWSQIISANPDTRRSRDMHLRFRTLHTGNGGEDGGLSRGRYFREELRR